MFETEPGPQTMGDEANAVGVGVGMGVTPDGSWDCRLLLSPNDDDDRDGDEGVDGSEKGSKKRKLFHKEPFTVGTHMLLLTFLLMLSR